MGTRFVRTPFKKERTKHEHMYDVIQGGSMSTESLVVRQVGYPDFWPVILERREKFFVVTKDLGPTIDDLFGGPEGSPRTDRLIAASVQWARMVMEKADQVCQKPQR